MSNLVCLDTRILSMFLKGKESALLLINDLKKQGNELYTTSINVSEFFMGFYKTNILDQERYEKITNFFLTLRPRPLDYESAELAGKIYATRLKGVPIGWRDTFIAAIVLNNGKKIITSNLEHFKRISELEIIEYY